MRSVCYVDNNLPFSVDIINFSGHAHQRAIPNTGVGVGIY